MPFFWRKNNILENVAASVVLLWYYQLGANSEQHHQLGGTNSCGCGKIFEALQTVFVLDWCGGSRLLTCAFYPRQKEDFMNKSEPWWRHIFSCTRTLPLGLHIIAQPWVAMAASQRAPKQWSLTDNSRSRTSGHYLWATYQLRPLCMVAFQRVGGSSGWLDLNSVQIRHFQITLSNKLVIIKFQNFNMMLPKNVMYFPKFS